MLLPVIPLDAAMSISDVLARFARYGLWLDPRDDEARAWISECAELLQLSFEECARQLQRDSSRFGAAIRRQWDANILWYAKPVEELLDRCRNQNPLESLGVMLQLHEYQSEDPIPAGDGVPDRTGVVVDAGTPVAVSFVRPSSDPSRGTSQDRPRRAPRFAGESAAPRSMSESREGEESSSAEATPVPAQAPLWPRLDAPDYAPAGIPFEVIVGLSNVRQLQVAGGPVQLPLRPGTTLNVTIELIASGLDAPNGWTRTLPVDSDNPTAATVTFELFGREPLGPHDVQLTMLEVRYVLGGTVCGTASRAMIIGRSTAISPPPVHDHGMHWSSQPSSASPVALQADEFAPDLTIEIVKTDGNAASGAFECKLYSPHPLHTGTGPFPINLGQDPKSFASSIVQIVRQFSQRPMLRTMLSAKGIAVAGKLPAAVFAALREIGSRVHPQAPSVLLVSNDPFVPWEIAKVGQPLDPARPHFLGAQTVLGRWLRVSPDESAAYAIHREGETILRPPPHPPARIAVKHMAVMAGMYGKTSGFKELPGAVQEAKDLVATYDAIPLAATEENLVSLLDAKLTNGFQDIGGVEAIHFAGHGNFDPTQADSSMVLLSSGDPLPSVAFLDAKYGGDQSPLFFLNACMAGIGDDLLGSAGGFPGNCLGGGFGGLVATLWEIDDNVGHQVALEFWKRSLPTAGGAPIAVGEVLRDIRAEYDSGGAAPPIPTYLAYVYYGHPRLTLSSV